MVEADFSSATGMKGTVRDNQAQALHQLKGGLKMRLQLDGIVMIARDNPATCHRVAVAIREWQDFGGFGAFTGLIRHTLVDFLGKDIAAIQVHLFQIQIRFHARNAGLPDPFQTPIRTPFAPIVIHCLLTRFMASRKFLGILRHQQTIPLQARIQAIQDQIKDAGNCVLVTLSGMMPMSDYSLVRSFPNHDAPSFLAQ